MNIQTYLPYDKALHVIAGVLVFAIAQLAIGPWAMIPVVIAAVGKEVYDKVSGKGTPEWQDAAFTIGGGLLGLLCSL